MKILLVDDDADIAKLLSAQLRRNNYTVEVAVNGEYAIDLLQVTPYSLVLLDVGLPKLSGIEVCQTLRQRGDTTPVLMLTGRDHVDDKVTGLDAGADDYLVKPFELDELTARVRALLRRNAEMGTALLSYGLLQFDPCTQTLTYDNELVVLRPKELAILELMLRYPTQIFAPDTLLNQLWNLADCPGKATIKSHIRSLRKQLNAVGANDIIETLRGRGYRLNPALMESAYRFTSPEAHPPQSPLVKGGSSGPPPCKGGVRGGIRLTSPEAHPPQSPLVKGGSSGPPPLQGGVRGGIRLTSPEAHPPQSGIPKAVIDQTWEQVQRTSWQRMVQLEKIVQPLFGANPEVSGGDRWCDICTTAMAIAHQLKGSLGLFGFQTASLQAKHIEQLLSVMAQETTSSHDVLSVQIKTLKALLAEQITDASILEPVSLSSRQDQPSSSRPLVVCWDQDWGEQLQQQSQALACPIDRCSPQTINSHLLKQTPALILLEVSTSDAEVDLGLLEVLIHNYRNQIPILAVIASNHLEHQVLAICQGTQAVIRKSWSIETILSILTEYAGVENPE